MRNFRKLEVWQDGIDLVDQVYALLENFPISEKFTLVSQMAKAVISIPSNIAEGCSRDTSKEFSRFLQIALGSSFELETQLIIANGRGYIDKDAFESILVNLHNFQKKTNALNNTVRSW